LHESAKINGFFYRQAKKNKKNLSKRGGERQFEGRASLLSMLVGVQQVCGKTRSY